MQSNFYYVSENLQASVNYSYTYPRQIDDSISLSHSPDSSTVRIADIAGHKANGIINYIFLKHYNINVRLNHVSSKKVGPGTTTFTNTSSFPAYFLSSVAVSAHDLFNLKGTMIQLVCNNIFDKQYYSPGILGQSGAIYPGSILQMGRNISVKIDYQF